MMATCPDDDDLHSPTDASEDSVEVKVLPILALSKKNKRKLAEPRKLDSPNKRSRRNPKDLATPAPSPFRPWSKPSEEPLSLVLNNRPPSLCGGQPTVLTRDLDPARHDLDLTRRDLSADRKSFSVASIIGDESSTAGSSKNNHPVQRNYKNMTRERRIEANARERTRVHTISAAFDTLRQTIPSYSHSQKLSKLSILRIACSYIVALSRVNDMDYSEGQTQPPLSECVDTVSRTLHAEGKVRKKKDE